MNESRFNAPVRELIEENPFAVRAVLKILDIRFTTSVPTLAVTSEATPRMLVGPSANRATAASVCTVSLMAFMSTSIPRSGLPVTVIDCGP